MTEQDDVAGDSAVAEEKLLSAQGPIEAEDLSRVEIGDLFGWAPGKRLLPDVGNSVVIHGVLDGPIIRRPAHGGVELKKV